MLERRGIAGKPGLGGERNGVTILEIGKFHFGKDEPYWGVPYWVPIWKKIQYWTTLVPYWMPIW